MTAMMVPVVKATIALFIIIDPLGLLPVFMGLTHNCPPKERFRIFAKSATVAFVLMVLLSFAGNGVLTFFGITLADFKIAGGILLLLLALKIVNGAHYGMSPDARPGVVPIAVPLLVGPGAITTNIVLLGTYGLWNTLLALVITFALSFAIFSTMGLWHRILGKTGSDVIAKMMGMLLAAIAVQFIRQGIQQIMQ
jgi:multiple antibiotic resistance protein